MRFNVSVRPPRNRQKWDKRAFLEPRSAIVHKSLIKKRIDRRSCKILNNTTAERESATP